MCYQKFYENCVIINLWTPLTFVKMEVGKWASEIDPALKTEHDVIKTYGEWRYRR
jgi:hypothetical protein